MQGPDLPALDSSINVIGPKTKDIRESIEKFLHKLEKEQNTVSWPSVLDNYALLSGQISTLMNAIKSEKTCALRNFPVVPHRLSQDSDQYLLLATENRVSLLSHAEVPDYLRTKPDPEVEQAERQLTLEIAAHVEQSASGTQVANFNKQCNKALEKLKSRSLLQRDVYTRGSFATPTSTRQQTQELFATFYYGRGMKSVSQFAPSSG